MDTGPTIYNYFVVKPINTGVLGVAIFFLISGFVIPLSISATSKSRFIISRIFRIYPTYLACTAFTIFAAYLSSIYWDVKLPYTWGQIAQNILLIHTLTDVKSIDFVNWTLAIEIKFYLVALLMSAKIRSGSLASILIASGLIVAIGIVATNAATQELALIQFMLIGVIFNFHLRELISTRALLLSVTACSALFFARWSATPWPSGFWQVAPSYLYGILIFSGCYALRGKFRESRIIDFLADISYPLYLVHSITGYAIIRLLTTHGVPMLASMLVALMASIAAAYLIHVSVEKPSNVYGKVIFRRNKAIRPFASG